MRKNILAAGAALLALGLVYGASYPDTLLRSLPIAALNMILGLITKASPGVETHPESANIRLLVDRGVVRASVYQVVFLDSRLILKRLSSINVTVILAFLLAFVGLEILAIVGALMGGITGFSLQEFLTQRRRNKISEKKELTAIGRGDVKIEYGDLVEARLVKSRLYLITESISLAVNFPRGYGRKIEPMLVDIFKSKFETEESVRAVKAAEKENEKRQHPGGDRGKLSRR